MIHTSRTVTVGKTESIINEPIVLYRGDREVEVEFAIIGSKFTFTNGGNVIQSTNATHGQLVVDTPTGENMFSEVTECHEGKVIFTITKEMIDELAEVGLYSFQIRLFDESQVSRVTIPPVYQGIEIRHPMAAEDETDLVDIGLVDYSVVRKNDYENVVTFLPNGDYNKTNWEEHDVISRDRLNKVENALYEINKSTEGLYPTFQNQYDEFSTKIDKDVKAYKEEMEDEVEQFERDMTQAFGEFKVDYKDEVHDRLDVVEDELEEVSEVVDGFSGEIESINTQLVYIENQQLNVKSFGAIGDGVNDDLGSFDEAVNFGIKNNIKKIIIPSGNYKLSDTFKLPSGFMLEGLGEVYIRQEIENSPVIATKEYFENTRPYGRTKITNINVIGNTSNGTNNHGILIWDYYTIIEKCNVSYCGGNGIHFTHKSENTTVPSGNLVENTIKDCHVRYTNLTPIYLGDDSNNKITDGILENIMASSNEGCKNDVFIGSSAGWFINNVHTYGKSEQSIQLRNCYNTFINNIYIENYTMNGLYLHIQNTVSVSNVAIKIQDVVDLNYSCIALEKSSVDMGVVNCILNNISLTNYNTNEVMGLENRSTNVFVSIDNYVVNGNYAEKVIRFSGHGKSSIKTKEGVNISKDLSEGIYTLNYDNTRIKQYQIAKFKGNSEQAINLIIPKMNDYSKMIGKLCIYGNVYDNGTLLASYSSDVFISSKTASNDYVVYNKELIASTGFSSNPILTVSRETNELIITFTPSDNRITGVVTFDYCVI